MKNQPVCKVDDHGNKYWYQNDQLQREDGPAIEYANGDKHWYQNDQLHREDGPAVEYAIGTKKWYQNDQLHREDGPAIEYANGNKQYWIKGNQLTENQHSNHFIAFLIKKNCSEETRKRLEKAGY